MPKYQVSYYGKTYTIDGPHPPTEQDMEEMLGVSASSAVSADDAVDYGQPLALGKKEPSTLESILGAGKSGLMGALEILGRPGELVSGTVAGARTGDWTRGLRAATESLAEPKQEESFNKVMEEAHVLDNWPKTRAIAGMAADVITDPTNLLAGPGFVRKGLIKGLETAGAKKAIAETLVGAPIGKAWAEKAIPAMAHSTPVKKTRELLSFASKNAPLKGLVGKSGRTAEELQYLADKVQQVSNADNMEFVNRFQHLYNLDAPERQQIFHAMAKPRGQEATMIEDLAQNGDARLKTAKNLFRDALNDIYKEDIKAGRLDKVKTLSGGEFRDNRLPLALQELTQNASDIPKLQAAFKAATDADGVIDSTLLFGELGTQGASSKTMKLAAKLQQEANPIHKGVVYPSADMRTLHFQFDQTTGALAPKVSSYVPNYLPAKLIEDNPEITINPFKTRMNENKLKTRTIGEAIDAGTPTDIAKVLLGRLNSASTAENNKRLLTQFAQEFSTQAGPNTKTLPPMVFEAMHPDVQKVFSPAGPNSAHLPKELVDHISRYTYKMNDGPAVEGVIRRGMKLFKTAATTLNAPGHQLTNFLGNVTNMYASTDMRPDEVIGNISKAMDALKGKNVLTGVKGMSTQDVLEAAKKYGTLGDVSGFAGEFANAPEKLTPTAKALLGQEGNVLAAFNPDNSAVKYLRDWNQARIEDPAKLALFYHELKSGKSMEDAALTVRKVLFDYSDLSDFEKNVMRQIVPFYTWTRKNLPLQLANMIERPSKANNQKRFLKLFWDVAKDDNVTDIDKSELPDNLQSGEVVPISDIRGKDGLPVYTRMKLPIFDLNLLSTNQDELMAKGGFMLSPALRMPIEWAINHRLGDQSNVKIRSGPDQPAGLIGRMADSVGMGRFAGVHTDPKTGRPKQDRLAKWAQESIPIPFGAVTRTIDSEMNQDSALNPALELFLRSVGFNPVQLSEDMLRRTRAGRTLKAKNSVKDAILGQP
jgi:hypothetical protein